MSFKHELVDMKLSEDTEVDDVNEEFRNVITAAAENKIGVRGSGGRKREGMRGWNEEIEKVRKERKICNIKCRSLRKTRDRG